MDDEVGLRIGQEEQADPGRPQYPPRHVVCAETSASQPPAARNTPAGREKHAASSEACAMLSPYSLTKYCGIQTDSAVKPPKTIEKSGQYFETGGSLNPAIGWRSAAPLWRGAFVSGADSSQKITAVTSSATA